MVREMLFIIILINKLTNCVHNRFPLQPVNRRHPHDAVAISEIATHNLGRLFAGNGIWAPKFYDPLLGLEAFLVRKNEPLGMNVLNVRTKFGVIYNIFRPKFIDRHDVRLDPRCPFCETMVKPS